MRFTGSVALRPVRLGFLVPPDDLASVSRVARLSACIWGGRFNPIIPLSEAAADRWLMAPGAATGVDLARGLVDFFEPDVLVEAEPGMAERLGWKTEPHSFGLPRVLALEELFQVDERGELEIKAGIDAIEPMFHLYDQGYKYTLRHPQPFLTIQTDPRDCFFDVVGGRYPDDVAFSYLRQSYDEVFSPEVAPATAETSLRILREGYAGPFWITRHQLEESFGRGLRDETIYIFDGSEPADLIDYWNFRLVERRVTPINVAWFAQHAELIREIVIAAHRPIPGNPFGTMFHANLTFAGSIQKERWKALLEQYLPDLEPGSFHIGYTPHLWSGSGYGRHRRETKIIVRARSESFDQPVAEDRSVRLPALAPQFLNTSRRFSEARWINLVMPHNFIQEDDIARVYPSGLWEPGYPRIGLGSNPRIAREGWTLDHRYDTGSNSLRLQSGRDAFIAWLKRAGITARPSEEGQVAAQVINAAGGLFAAGMFCSMDTVRLLNQMAEGHVELGRDGKKILSTIPTRAKHINTISQHFAKREKSGFGYWNKLSHFLDCSVFRAGLRVQCPTCAHHNWFDLDAIGYDVTCSRCLNEFAFSQAPDKLAQVEWYYRVIGPFAAPDYARGAYAVALTLRCLSPQHHAEITWSTGLVLDTLQCEVDFMAWCRPERMLDEERDEPALLIGEAKSFGTNAFDQKSIEGLKTVAERFAGAIMVVSTLREITEFSPTEIDRLRDLAKWGRRARHKGHPINPLIVLTGKELFCEMGLDGAWRKHGDPEGLHPAYDLADPRVISEVSLKRYLGMHGYWEEVATRQDLARFRARLQDLIAARAAGIPNAGARPE